MEPKTLSPKESLELIKGVILEAKQRQEANGVIYIYWGLIIALAGIAHYILQEIGAYGLIFVPYLFLPVAVIVSFFIFPYYKKENQKNLIGRIIGGIWLFAGINMMVLGFALAMKLGSHLTPFIMILEGLAIGGTGLAASSRTLIIAGILANAVGLAAFWIPVEFHPLLMSGVNIFALALPGIFLNSAHRKRKNV